MMSYRDGDTVLRGAFVERWRWRGRAPRWPGWRASTAGCGAAGPAPSHRSPPGVLACHGGADPHVPPAEVTAFVDEMTAAAADWQLCAYRGAAHGFTHRPPSTAPGVAFDAVADARSASALRLFLAEL